MTATTIWIPVVAALLGGLFVLAGVLATARLTSAREHRRWVLDNKKLEWRELMTELFSCGYTMARAFRQMRTDDDLEAVANAVHQGRAAIRNRIFIAGALQKHSIEDRWSQLVTYVNAGMGTPEPSVRLPATSQGYTRLVLDLQADLLKIAREDLQL